MVCLRSVVPKACGGVCILPVVLMLDAIYGGGGGNTLCVCPHPGSMLKAGYPQDEQVMSLFQAPLSMFGQQSWTRSFPFQRHRSNVFLAALLLAVKYWSLENRLGGGTMDGIMRRGMCTSWNESRSRRVFGSACCALSSLLWEGKKSQRRV